MSHQPVHIACALLLALWVGAAGASPAERLGAAVRFKTISYQDREQIDYTQFDAFRQFLRESFPLVFSTLEVETVNQYSLLVRWPGSDHSLPPVLFTASMDLGPLEP